MLFVAALGLGALAKAAALAAVVARGVKAARSLCAAPPVVEPSAPVAPESDRMSPAELPLKAGVAPRLHHSSLERRGIATPRAKASEASCSLAQAAARGLPPSPKNGGPGHFSAGKDSQVVYAYDSAHRLRSVLPAGTSRPTLLDYDAMENLVKMTNSNGQATFYRFDRLNRNLEMQYPGGDGETFQYDANSNLVAWNRGDFTVAYTFDELDRLTRLDSPGTSDHIALTYDTLDRVATMTDNSGTTTYGYTNNYLLDHVTRGSSVVAYGYDAGDRLITLTADGDTTTYDYDDRDRLVQSTLDGQSVSYAYDLADRPTLMSFSNGVVCQQVFNERDGLLSKRYLKGGSPLFSLKNAYNQLGQRIFEEKKTANWKKSTRYAYNKRRELSHSYRRVNNDCTVETSYSYDQNHNRIKKNETTYRSNANDQLTSVRRPNQTLNYNSAGQAQQAGSSAFTFAYNDQIKTVQNGPNSATYLYDGNGQRVQKTVDGVVSKFLWAGSEIIKEYNASGQVKAQYLLGAERTAIKTNGRWNFYVTDGLGSTVMLTDYRGRPVATWDYDDFGETTQLSGSPSVYNPFLYTGQELDKETGFYHLRARHYAPSLGKFLSRDPIGYAGGTNLYSYCAGDSINYVDPSGLEPPAPTTAGEATWQLDPEGNEQRTQYRRT